MFSDPFDSSSIFYENPSSNNSFLMTLPSSLLDDEELLFEHFHHSPHSPINLPPFDSSSMNNNNLNTNSMEIGKFDHTQKDGDGGAKRKRAVAPAKKKQPTGGGTGRRRPGKKDRHSKIYTAQGPRDRRMRLSLQIARKFFDLQDMLGFDKASKTIEWLFSKSKSAIRDLTATLPPHQRKGSLMTSCVASSSSTSVSNEVNLEGLGGVKDSKPTRNEKLSSSRVDAREKARARARQRTLEKNKQKELTLETNPNKLGSSSTPETVDNLDQFNSTLENQMSSVSIIEKLLGSDSSASSSSIYNECSYLNFSGNWGTDSLNMYPSYGATNGVDVDELQVILQQQNPKSISSAGSSGYQGRNLL